MFTLLFLVLGNGTTQDIYSFPGKSVVTIKNYLIEGAPLDTFHICILKRGPLQAHMVNWMFIKDVGFCNFGSVL